MEKLKMHSPDLTQQNIARIQELFPGCVTEGADVDGSIRLVVDFDLLKQELSNAAVDGPQERYRLDWPGKREAMLAANTPIARTLRPYSDPDESVDFDNTQNLFIEGDNLEALKLLQESYLGKVKMIYIDPPYNTGNDFIYRDNYAEEVNVFLENDNQKDDMGRKLVDNPRSYGRFHSDWLNFMYPRLKLARNLLKEDGLILISIDDNELKNLWTIACEIFGTDNSLACLPRKTKSGGGSAAHQFAIEHDYVIVFAKSKDKLGPLFIPHDKEYIRRYAESDEIGPYFWDTMERSSTATRPYEITAPDGTMLKGKWFRSQDRFISDLESGEVRFLSKGESDWSVQFKQRMAEGRKMRSLLVDNEFRANPNDLAELGLGNLFSFPKPVHLMRHFMDLVRGDDFIMDFFAGSGTTAQAILEANAADGGNRKFILVQLPEPCDEKSEAYVAGYKTIAEISKERIRRSGKKILEGDFHETWNKDVGFRVLKVDSSNMTDVRRVPDAVEQSQLDVFVDSVKPDRTAEDLLFQVILDWGSAELLTGRIYQDDVEGKTVFSVEGNSLVACFAEEISEALVSRIASRMPLRVVFKDSGFTSDSARTNAEQIFARISPDTQVKTI